LINKNHKIVSLDIVPFDYEDCKDKIKIVTGDIRDKSIVDKYMTEIDIVIHTAATLPLYKPEDIYNTDVDGTQNLLEAAKNKNVKRFIHISSTAVYGIPDHHPINEDDKLDGVGDYGKAKIMAEEVCLKFRDQGMCVPVIRPKSFIVPERLGVFALFYDWVKDGRGFPMIGKCDNRYQLLDVEYLCEAIHQCIVLDENLVNDRGKKNGSMKENYQAVLDYAGCSKKITALPEKLIILLLKLLELLKLSPLYKRVYETASKDSFKNENGISHRVPWKQGILAIAKKFF
jgi:nucleoside-diphosphate-sugar epimerase